MTDIAPAGATATDLLNSGGTAPPAAPVYRPEGMPVTPAAFDAPEAAAARAEIATLKADKEFYKTLQAEKDRGGPAHQKWAELHAKGWPAPTQIGSQTDVDAQASARTAQQWNAFLSGLGTQMPITPEIEAELKGGVILDDIFKQALQQKELLVKDRAFYRRLLDGDAAARERWARVTAACSLRPVPASYFTDRRS